MTNSLASLRGFTIGLALFALAGCIERPLIEIAAPGTGPNLDAAQPGAEDADGFTFDPTKDMLDAAPKDVLSCALGACQDAGPVCGNSVMDDGETCDDGNARPGDGCSGLCRVELNYKCDVVGQPCVSTIVCGDGKVMGGEACDDNNVVSKDGCSELCEVESGYACSVPGQPCVPAKQGRCGDGMVNEGEGCDDGNAVSFDGCSGTCSRESGYTCAQPNQPCVRDEYCGDGALAAGEECDDKNLLPGDGCTGTCKVEPFFMCAMPGKPCSSTIICGDAKVVADEACDDGNTMASDGCSADCKQIEPGFTCPRALGVGGPCTAVPMNRCGDSRLSYGEFCDDGNTDNMDGCSSACRVEAGYTCDAPGTACALVEWCGNGKLSLANGEQCDDGNDVGGDGCSSQCVIEANYVCPAPGKLCTSTIKCGDGIINGTETCDDGNTKNSDGCSSTCMVESGWVCTAGSVCKAKQCGDGIIAGDERCDDKNSAPADGCSATCQLELPSATEANGWVCPVVGMPCQRTNCGNGIQEGSEQCDDGNNDSGDLCSPFCRKEPVCPAAGGACSTACGDGLLLPIDIANGQECDDGNTVAGDGCSATCKVEQGYICSGVAVSPDPLILPLVLRDFKAYNETNGHPDFEQYNGQETGIVKSLLGANGKPVHVDGRKDRTTNNDPGSMGFDYFGLWYKDDASYNKTVKTTMPFTKLMTGEYQYNNSSFFPLDGLGWGNHPYNNYVHNFHFTSEVRYWFEYKGNEQLDFTGDDDVWVFVNKTLAVDLGGVHGARSASLKLGASDGKALVCDLLNDCNNKRTVDLGLVIGSVYEIVVFQAERHTTQSNYRLTLSNFNANKSQCVPKCGDGFVTRDEACDLGTAKNTGAYGTCNANCTLPARCGDAVVSNGEECDDGVNSAQYSTSTKLCAAGCKWAPRCGDGKVDSANGEACDQGIDNGKGYGYCSATCQLGPRCGDAKTTDGEQCDDGAAKNGTSASLCMDTCKLKCGNALPDPGEECDDGAANNTGAYGKCKADCHLGPRCGDGIPNGGEQCDDGKNDGTYGTCGTGCLYGPRCGDMVVQSTAGEVCDAGANNMSMPYGKNQCTLRCRPAPYCGDKTVDVDNGEKCDDGINSGQPGSCLADCSGAVPLASCGDGAVQPPEQCDSGINNGTAGSSCDTRCRNKCGNGFKDPGEQCDDGKNTGAYATCNANCTLASYCGDGQRTDPEDCDLGANNSSSAYGVGKCTTACTAAPFCGDGRIQTAYGEACDGGVGCSAICTIVPVL